MHPAPLEILHVFQAENRKASVQRVNDASCQFRIVYQTRINADDDWRTHAPDYLNNEDAAKGRARRWAYGR